MVFPVSSVSPKTPPRIFSINCLGSHRGNSCAEAGVEFFRGTGEALAQRAASADLRFIYHRYDVPHSEVVGPTTSPCASILFDY